MSGLVRFLHPSPGRRVEVELAVIVKHSTRVAVGCMLQIVGAPGPGSVGALRTPSPRLQVGWDGAERVGELVRSAKDGVVDPSQSISIDEPVTGFEHPAPQDPARQVVREHDVLLADRIHTPCVCERRDEPALVGLGELRQCLGLDPSRHLVVRRTVLMEEQPRHHAGSFDERR